MLARIIMSRFVRNTPIISKLGARVAFKPNSTLPFKN